MGIYSTTPPTDGFHWEDVQAEVDSVTDAKAFAEQHEGPVTIESYTVMHERDGSMTNAIVACLTPDGARTWATSTDADVMKAMTSDDLVGRAAGIEDGVLRVE
jgi:acetyl-CoA C-acetyltransferase